MLSWDSLNTNRIFSSLIIKIPQELAEQCYKILSSRINLQASTCCVSLQLVLQLSRTALEADNMTCESDVDKERTGDIIRYHSEARLNSELLSQNLTSPPTLSNRKLVPLTTTLTQLITNSQLN